MALTKVLTPLYFPDYRSIPHRQNSFRDTYPKLYAPWKGLLFERKRTRSDQGSRSNESCPILKIPPEVTIQIFMIAFPESSFSSWGPKTPLLLGSICHSWREIAWSFPLLWSSVSLSVRCYTRTKNELLREWLTRSGDLPLSIHFQMHEPMTGTVVNLKKKTKKIIYKAMDIVARCSERWKNIDFCLLAMFHHKICFVPTRLPLLVSMSIMCQNPERFSEEYGSLSKISWNAPKLRHIRLDTELENYLAIPLDQITTFSWIGYPSSYQCLKILQDIPNLVRYKYTSTHYQDWHHTLPVVTALQLKALEVAFYDDDVEIEEIVNKLTLPALEELSVRVINSTIPPFPHITFTSLISRSGCHLTRLSLINLILSTSQLDEWLLATPSLTELRLEETAITSKILRSLSVDQALQRILLPKLEHFTYINITYTQHTFNFGVLADMAVSRWNYDSRISAPQEVAQLKSIYVETHGGEDSPSSLFEGNDRSEGDKESGEALERADKTNNEASGEYWKVYGSERLSREENKRVKARFQELIAEGMNIRILGWQH